MKSDKLFAKANRRGVFGLTSVQQFFAIILGVALLAYVIVVIMGTLSGSTILPTGTLNGTVLNESGAYLNTSNAGGYTLGQAGLNGFNPTITLLVNASGYVINAGNYTVFAGELINTTAPLGSWTNNLNVSYTFTYNSAARGNANTILSNTSSGITSFFSSINPVYAILAILVIILVLVVLVRVVTGGVGIGQPRAVNPQL